MASLKAAEKKIAAIRGGPLAQRVPALVANASLDRLGHRSRRNTSARLASADDVRTPRHVGARTPRQRRGGRRARRGGRRNARVVIVATNDAARAAGVKAGALAKIAAGVLGGGGGGKDDIAQGGGTDVAAIPAALDAIAAAIAS